MFVDVTLLLRKNVISKLLQQLQQCSDNSYNIVTCIKITAKLILHDSNFMFNNNIGYNNKVVTTTTINKYSNTVAITTTLF